MIPVHSGFLLSFRPCIRVLMGTIDPLVMRALLLGSEAGAFAAAQLHFVMLARGVNYLFRSPPQVLLVDRWQTKLHVSFILVYIRQETAQSGCSLRLYGLRIGWAGTLLDVARLFVILIILQAWVGTTTLSRWVNADILGTLIAIITLIKAETFLLFLLF